MKVSCHPLSRISWDDVAPLIGDSFFGSPGFANLWCTLGGKPVYWLVEQGNRIMAVLPGVEFGIRPLKRFYAMPAGCYARLFYSPTATVDRNDISNCVITKLLRARYVKWFVYDYHRSFQLSVPLGVQQCQTTLVDISVSQWKPPDKRLQAEITKAYREGIQMELFNPDKHFSKFLALMESTEKRYGRCPTYPSAFFMELARLGQHDPRVHWVWCEHNGQAAASHIYFIEDDMVINWQTYHDRKSSFLKANQYMLFTTARELALKGVKCLNLSASPENAPGVEYYKGKWGGEKYYYDCYFHKSALGKLV